MDTLLIFAFKLFRVCTVVATVIAVILKWRFSYWKRRGLGTLPPNIPSGNIKFFDKDSHAVKFQKIYNQFKSRGWKHGGLYRVLKVVYIPIDPEIIKCILQKDFDHFVNRSFAYNENDPLIANLFNLRDEKWRNLRSKLTPTFTSGKMKIMFNTVRTCTGGLMDLIEQYVKDKTPVDVKEILSRFGADVINSCVLGLDCESFKNPDSEYMKVRKLMTLYTTTEKWKRLCRQVIPKKLEIWLGLKQTKPELAQFIMRTVKATIDHREKNNLVKKDFMQLLIDLRNKDDGHSLTMTELEAQIYLFLTAGSDTTSTAMAFLLYELAVNQAIQEKVRQEIRTTLVKYDGEITYVGIMDMIYTQKAIDESLRKWPPGPILLRVCTKDYVVPGTTVKIDRGTTVTIPVFGLHRDPEYWPDPDRFDPERFSDENKNLRRPFTWLPFGEGSRHCIGLRFAQMQIKVGLANILNKYRITLNERTEVPLQTRPTADSTLAPKGGIWLDAEKIS